MAISIFPPASGGGGDNNFVVDMNETSNNTADTGGPKSAGPYSVSISSGDSSFDIYLVNAAGETVGYSNGTSVTASASFDTVVILGVSSSEVISFSFAGSVNNAISAGNETGAGAYLTSASPSVMHNIDDTTTLTGGNFASDVEIYFTSGASALMAKNIVRTSSTQLIVTRPDALIQDNAPYGLKAINPGVSQPTGSNLNVLANVITAGSDPVWVTGATLNQAGRGTFYTLTLSANDSGGAIASYIVTGGTITPGLTLASSTGVLSGTPTTSGEFTFTVTATDTGGNTTPRTFTQAVVTANGGIITSAGGFTYHTFTSSGTFEVLGELSNAEYLVVAGGGGGGTVPYRSGLYAVGGGGAGGVIQASISIPLGQYAVTVGAGAGWASQGSDSSLGNLFSATGGGGGESGVALAASAGGSGGGGGYASDGAGTRGSQGGQGISGQGFASGGGSNSSGQGGGGRSERGGTDGTGAGGDGINLSTWATATTTGFDSMYGGGGAGGAFGGSGIGALGGAGGGGNGSRSVGSANSNSGSARSGGGGGGGDGTYNTGPFYSGGGGSGVAIVRYAS
jgi:hypothetical protein